MWTDVNVGEQCITGLAIGGMAKGEWLTLGIRPEHLSLQSQAQSIVLQGALEATERLGDLTYLYLLLEGGLRITVAEQGDHQLVIDERVSVYARYDQLHFFNAKGQNLRCS